MALETSLIFSRLVLFFFFFFFFVVFLLLGQHGVDTALVDDTYTVGRHLEAHPTVFARYPKAMGMEIGQKATLGLVVGMGHIVPARGPLARNLAHSGHGITS